MIRKLHLLLMAKFLMLLFSLSSESLFAQEFKSNENVPNIVDVQSFVASLNPSKVATASNNAKKQNLEDLLYHVQPSVYLFEGSLKTYGNKPTRLFTDINSLNQIPNANLPGNNIEMVSIVVNTNQNSKIDLNLFDSFKNLKYIYIISNAFMSKDQIASLMVNYKEKYGIFYTINTADTE